MSLESADGAAPLIDRIRAAANAIPDPCSLAQGYPVGMTDMGLLRTVEARPTTAGWRVHIQARVTAPDCLHMVYFERELRDAVAGMPEVAALTFAWDGGYDWTPADMSPAVQRALRERRERNLAARAPATEIGEAR